MQIFFPFQGKDVTVNVKTQPNSFVGLMAVEKVCGTIAESDHILRYVCKYLLIIFFFFPFLIPECEVIHTGT